MLPQDILDLPSLFAGKTQRHGPSHGCIGMHPTLLPIGRGRAPIPWTILRGIRSSGVSAFRLETDADAGNIVAFEPFAIEETDTATTLFEKVATAHKTLGTRLAGAIARQDLSDRVQDATQATVWERRTPSDSWLDFCGTTASLLRQIKACQAPYPLAFFAVGDCIVQVLNAEPAKRQPTALPLGTLRVDGDNIFVSVADGDIRITRYLVNGVSAALPVERHACATAARALDEHV
jgi:methionyl-tRNA formyltransferase